MKNLIYLFIFLTVIFTGCEDKPDLSTKPDNTKKVESIKLPAKTGTALNKVFYKEQTINGVTGGEILLDETYPGGPFGRVRVYAHIKFPPNSFTGQVTFSMTVSDDEAVLTFLPSKIFNAPALLDVSFEGIDLTGINPSTVNFYYLNDDGSTENVSRSLLVVDTNKGRLLLDDAVIPHFTRLGFAR